MLTRIRQCISKSEWRESVFGYCMIAFVLLVSLLSFNWHGFEMFLSSLLEHFIWGCFGIVLLLALCVLYLIPGTVIGLLLKGSLLFEYPAAKIAKHFWPQNRWANKVVALHKTCARMIALMMLTLSAEAFGRAQTVTPPNSQQEHSRRIHEILQKARSYQAANAKTGAALQEIVGRQTRTFAEFEKQCTDLQTTLAESDAMEKKKRKMLADLQFEFQDDSKVKPVFNLLYQMEDVSDKVEPIWRGMIACSGILASAAQNKQEAYQTICVDPAHQQLSLLVPEINRLGQQLQAEVQEYGGSLPRDFLQVIGQ